MTAKRVEVEVKNGEVFVDGMLTAHVRALTSGLYSFEMVGKDARGTGHPSIRALERIIEHAMGWERVVVTDSHGRQWLPHENPPLSAYTAEKTG
jgi:hypothetical protein